jgi:Flp pilus assembly protein TadD
MVLATWVIVQPLRSQGAYNAALTQLTRGNTAAALTDARRAQASNPLSVDPLWLQSAIYTSAGNHAAARRALIKATSIQPSNPNTWARLGCYDLQRGRTRLAFNELLRAGAMSPAINQAVRANDAQFCSTVNA